MVYRTFSLGLRIFWALSVFLLVPNQAARAETMPPFGLGARLGFLKATRADDPIAYGGVLARFHLTESLAIEGSVDYRRESYENGDITVRTIPVMATGLFFIAPNAPISPYLLAGAGWYYLDIDNTGRFITLGNVKRNRIGAHVGGGVAIPLSRFLVIDGNLRYVFLNLNEPVKDIKADALLGTVGVILYF